MPAWWSACGAASNDLVPSSQSCFCDLSAKSATRCFWHCVTPHRILVHPFLLRWILLVSPPCNPFTDVGWAVLEHDALALTAIEKFHGVLIYETEIP